MGICLQKVCFGFNPVVPMLPVPACGEHWPLLCLWRHYLWREKASLMLKIFGRKRTFQWYPDQSHCLNVVWNMHENAKKLARKTPRKERSSQWYPDQTNCLNVVWSMHENVKKLAWKTPRKERSFQWYPVQNDCLNVVWNAYKNAKEISVKNSRQTCINHPWLPHSKNFAFWCYAHCCSLCYHLVKVSPDYFQWTLLLSE